MGKIRLSAFKSQLSLFDEKPMIEERPVVNEKHDVEHVEGAEHIEVHSEDTYFPILPRKTKKKDLPFVPSTEIKKRTGQGCDRLWIVVDNIVLDVTDYQHKHPGGHTIIAGFGGQDCSWQWWSFHNRTIWQAIASGIRVGRTEGIVNQHQRPPAVVGLRKHGFNDWE